MVLAALRQHIYCTQRANNGTVDVAKLCVSHSVRQSRLISSVESPKATTSSLSDDYCAFETAIVAKAGILLSTRQSAVAQLCINLINQGTLHRVQHIHSSMVDTLLSLVVVLSRAVATLSTMRFHASERRRR